MSKITYNITGCKEGLCGREDFGWRGDLENAIKYAEYLSTKGIYQICIERYEDGYRRNIEYTVE